EAGESLARTSGVPRPQLLAWYDSARIWLDDVNDVDHGLRCLGQAASLDGSYEDVFPPPSAPYTRNGAGQAPPAPLPPRIANVTSPEERVELEVERGKALADVGDTEGAQKALKAALADRPDHLGALGAYGDLCAKVGDWDAAEQAWVRLARSLTAPE